MASAAMVVGVARARAQRSGDPPFDLAEASVSDLRRRLETGQDSAASLVEKYQARIDAIDQAGPRLNSVIEVNPDLLIESRNDKAFLIEVAKGSTSLTGQVTDLGAGRSLLYVWADAGESGVTGEELATSVVQNVCDELGVEHELVNY